MANSTTRERQASRGGQRAWGVVALGMALALTARADAGGVTPPEVPEKLRVGDDFVAFLVGHATGTQNYVCLPSTTSPTGFAYTLFTPQATLFTDQGHQVTTHFFSPNPAEGGVVRATWEHSQDTSTVWGRVKEQSSDSPFVTPGAIPWLLIEIKGAYAQPTGSHKLAGTKLIHRVNTVGGSAPETGCASSEDIGKRAYVPYAADYFFYESRHPEADGN